MQLARFCLALALLVAFAPAHALLIRADRDDSEYLELASRYGAALRLASVEGEGVLIAPRWVLTAASVAARIRALQSLRVADRDVRIETVFSHPDASLALVFLRDAVDGVEPMPIYRENDENGKAIVIVAHGPTGVIGDKAAPAKVDHRTRAAINTVDRVEARAFATRIKPADEASDLQGAVTATEVGHPAFIETRTGIFVAGVGLAPAGDWEPYLRVSAFADWIDATMFKAAQAEAAKK